MGKVRNILEGKPKAIFAVPPGSAAYNAIELMCEKNISSLLITEGEKLVGIFTERDAARKLILKGKSSKDTPIGELMTANPVTVTSETTIADCMLLMTDKRIRHLPVVEGDKLVGMISIGDVVRHTIEEQKDIIEYLENYIAQ